MRKVVFSPRARRQFAKEWTWWRRNRDKAPEAFDEEVTSTLEKLAGSPFDTGFAVRARRPGLRRVSMERIRYYLYYRVNDDEIEVVAIWHASRRSPRL